jgi:hypothetical protein
MTESNEGREFGAVEFTEEDAVKDWRALGREDLLRRAIIALDGAKMEAEEVGDEHYVRHVDAVLFPFLKAELETMTGEADLWLTPEERRIWDARAKEEAWGHAVEVLLPMQEIARVNGSDELIEVLKDAEKRCSREINAALDELAALTGEEV